MPPGGALDTKYKKLIKIAILGLIHILIGEMSELDDFEKFNFTAAEHHEKNRRGGDNVATAAANIKSLSGRSHPDEDMLPLTAPHWK